MVSVKVIVVLGGSAGGGGGDMYVRWWPGARVVGTRHAPG